MKYPIWLGIALFLGTCSCDNSQPKTIQEIYRTIDGSTMGTYYRVTYAAAQPLSQTVFDHLFETINSAVSTYDSTSLIRHFNRAGTGAFDLSQFESELQQIFSENLLLSDSLYRLSNGYFDPTVMPLVNFWGFGFDERTSQVRSLPPEIQERVGWNKIQFDKRVGKRMAGTELDFSAVAKGYAVDLTAQLLDEKGSHNYLIDIGGEMRARGVNNHERIWTIGINKPAEEAALNEYEIKLKLADRSLATSGNYRNFHVLDDGRKVSHTINPKTGYPERSSLLSATIATDACAWADGLATTCMVVGLEAALDLIEHDPDSEGFFIYTDSLGVFQNKMTKGFAQLVME